MADDFDPRHAALYHASRVENENSGQHAQAEAVTALACGMIYIGDQVARLAEMATGHTQPTASKHYGAGQVRAR